ncbi:hypothetical protein M514_08590 [Trichuris suis]|uniref:Uncharacterized protein n=1 Tax=Trichuris suis TaxID=68888 RepID=A0A085N1V8_9BILA|nr:hypothetical protein M513_08590 [Trichuris suis]KFD63454.1 hypothetical protein M514_08590 [Trichuris suis]
MIDGSVFRLRGRQERSATTLSDAVFRVVQTDISHETVASVVARHNDGKKTQAFYPRATFARTARHLSLRWSRSVITGSIGDIEVAMLIDSGSSASLLAVQFFSQFCSNILPSNLPATTLTTAAGVTSSRCNIVL